MRNILCIIPARSGSKSILHKNIKYYKDKPLIAWTIEQALQCKYISRVIVSTDSQEYADIAIKYGADVPFLRPIEISLDDSLDYSCMYHCIKWLEYNENYIPDIILHLRCTYPTRKIDDINNALNIFINNYDNYDSLRSIIECTCAYKMYNINNNNLVPLFNSVNNIQEPYNSLSQLLPKCYLHNGYIDIFNAKLINDNTISGKKIYPYIMDSTDNINIDEHSDWIIL